MGKATFKIGVFAVVLDDSNKVLLCHRRDYDLWNLPGGGLERHESPQDGLIREVKEEVGLDVEVIRLAGVYAKPDREELVLSFVCNIKGGSVTLMEEADRVEYFELSGIPPNTSPKQVERIKDALETKFCVMKTQMGPSSAELIKEGRLG